MVHWTSRTREPARLAGALFAARGLQLQKIKDNPAVFVDHLAISLAIVRNLQNHNPSLSALYAENIESRQIDALTRWLEQLDGWPDLLARAAQALHQHRVWLPADYHDQQLADYLIGLNSLDTPEKWLAIRPIPGAVLPDSLLLQSSCRLPYEQERQRRLLRTLHWAVGATVTASLSHESLMTVPPTWHSWRFGSQRLKAGKPRRLVRLAAAELMVALRRFQADTGQPAERLEQLVPKYLAHIPEDPFSGQSFRYRLSKGEDIVWPQHTQPLAGGPVLQGPTRHIVASQGILWSVGEDRHDDDAKHQGLGNGDEKTHPGEDLIYLVPLPKPKP
jgi:hypothetical protein